MVPSHPWTCPSLLGTEQHRGKEIKSYKPRKQLGKQLLLKMAETGVSISFSHDILLGQLAELRFGALLHHRQEDEKSLI